MNYPRPLAKRNVLTIEVVCAGVLSRLTGQGGAGALSLECLQLSLYLHVLAPILPGFATH